MISILKDEISELKNIALSELTPQVGIRAGHLPVGKAILSAQHVREARKDDTGVAKGCWPIERWMRNGSVEIVPLGGDHCYDIPVGALSSPLVRNLWFAGRSISAEDEAIASARVIGSALGTGYAAGFMATRSLEGMAEEEVIGEIRREQKL